MPAEVAAPTPAAADEGHANLATRLVALYVFLLFGRILEMLQMFGLAGLRIMLLISITALVAVFLTGNILRVLRTPLGVLLLAWTGWMIICMPFSSWRSESLNQFAVIWLKSLMVFFIVAGLGSTLFAFRNLMSAMGWAAAAACLLVLPGLSNIGPRAGIDRLIGVGSLSNPNEIAFHLWLGMAFLVALLVRSGRGKKLMLGAICLLELAIILKTVSREGLLLALIVVVLAVLHVSFSNKIKIAIASVLVCLFAATTLPRESLDRYLTVFTHNVSGDAVASAEASSRARKQKLQESIQLTMRHPIFGVGMGVFMPASVDLAKENRMQPDWEVSHNSYTQVSSELGLPGLLILIAIFYTAFRQILQLSRAAKRAGHDDVRKLAVTLLIALVVLSVHFCFDSIAYVFYLPLVTGLVAAFSLNYAPLPLEIQHPAEPPLRPVRHAILEPVPPGPLRQPPSLTTPQQSKVAGSRNPYRFGRRRRATLGTEPEA